MKIQVKNKKALQDAPFDSEDLALAEFADGVKRWKQYLSEAKANGRPVNWNWMWLVRIVCC
ncbi:MAG TPA: hypothetical protein VGQ53_08600 [Chitinophagaceae bacterium]|jgi:hypothetical protein|nr:hypothetical protein [Chitinophagaceae bacterium]